MFFILEKNAACDVQLQLEDGSNLHFMELRLLVNFVDEPSNSTKENVGYVALRALCNQPGVQPSTVDIINIERVILLTVAALTPISIPLRPYRLEYIGVDGPHDDSPMFQLRCAFPSSEELRKQGWKESDLFKNQLPE